MMWSAADIEFSWDDFGIELTALYEAYRRVHGAATPGDFVAALMSGLVLCRDLKLERAVATCASAGGHPSELSFGDDELLQTAALQRILDELCSLTMEDPLTGLFNRRYFEHRLRLEGRRAIRAYRPLSVMMIDVDDFKKLNDRHGHLAGDQALRSIADAIRRVLRSTDEVTSRIGGEEFAVLMPDTAADGILVAAERVRSAVEGCQGEGQPPVTVSIGTATLDPTGRVVSPEQVLDHADQALYQAKEHGRNLVRRFEPPATKRALTAVSRRERDALFE